MKRNKITAVILSIVMSMSLMMPSVEVLADEASAPSETQKTETVETKEPKATEKQTPKETEKQESKETETQKPKETEKQEPKETEKQEPKETEKQEPVESGETQITETSGSDEKEPAESKDNGDNPEESNETDVVEGNIPSQSASTPKKNAVTGTCGDNLTWTFEDGTLTISGSGKMTDWFSVYNVPWYVYRENISSVVFSGNIASIGRSAFSYCSSLTSITIPNSVTSIGAAAFQSCSNLTNITIPSGVTSISDGAFGFCSSLTSITIANSVTSIGESAFQSCSNLTSITIPNSVASIGKSAFQSCSNLTNITIPNSVTFIGGSAFYKCSSLTSIIIPNGVTKIGDYAFYGCSSLTSITIQNGVLKSIGVYAFCGCSSLTGITIPNSVTFIGDHVFYGCSSLTSITILNGISSLGESAFEECSNLTSITIPNSVTSIGVRAFFGCSNLTNITIPNSVGSIGRAAFYECSSLTSIIIPNGVTKISDSTFYECSSLTSITIPDSVTSIGRSAFAYCSSLTNITIPNSVTSIGSSVFSYSRLTSITIPDSVTNISDNAFYCSSLTSITIPKSITLIAKLAFGGCSKLKDVYYDGTEDDWNAITISEYNEYLKNANIHYGTEYSITVNSGMSDLAQAAEGTTVTVTANATTSGKVFDKWTVVSGNVKFANELSSTTTFTMPAENVEVTAMYKNIENNYSVKVNNGNASPATATAGTVITITADTAPSGKVFDKWIVDSGTVSLSNVSSSTTTFTMPAKNVEVTATYKNIANTYSVKVNNGSATPATATAGTVITLKADAAPSGKAFDKWIVDSGTVSLSNASYSTTTFTMPAENVEVTATYKTAPSSNFIVKVNSGFATPSTSAPGKLVNVTANDAPAGTEFDKWEVVSGTVIFADASSATTSFVMPAENVEITAKYKSSLSVKGKTATVKYSKVKKKNQTLAVSKVLTFVDKGQGQLSFSKVSGNSKILINKTTGNITVKKKLKKKTYTVKVKVMASGNESCNPSEWKTVTFKIKVK